MTRADILQMLDISQGRFDKHISPKLKWTFNGARKKFFYPLSEMTEEAQHNYQHLIEEYEEKDPDAQQVEEILGDISQTPGASFDDLNAARLENLKARTSLINEKLDSHKQQIWTEWSKEFFEAFSEAFAKVKNSLISLHLKEEQLEMLNEGIENALKNLQDKLDAMWNRFKTEEEEEEQK